MSMWDPVQYQRALELRRRPIQDLIAQVPLEAPGLISDLGCGPGNSTEFLAQRWPSAHLVGVDSSPEMLGAARSAHPDWHWQEADLAGWSAAEPQDLVFSSSALHWVKDHPTLMPRLLGCARPGGVLAVQMPGNFGLLPHTLIRELAAEAPWRSLLGPSSEWCPLGMADYHGILAPFCDSLSIWETTYLQVVNDVEEILGMLKGAALRPLTRRLNPDLFEIFVARLRQRMLSAFPQQASGKVLWPFRRIFIVAVRSLPGRSPDMESNS